jgi:hypothetical protein
MLFWYDYCFTKVKPTLPAMKKLMLIFSILILILSCEKVDKICNCKNPLKDLPWLREIKASFTNCTCQVSIIQADYNRHTVFYSLMDDPLCNSYQLISLYDCSGNSINTFNSTDQSFVKEVTNQKVIYTCNTSK